MTGDAMREPADVLDELASALHQQGYCGEVCVCVDDARALLPTVQALIADAEKRAAAAELRAAADDWEALVQREKPPVRGSAWLKRRADALDPS